MCSSLWFMESQAAIRTPQLTASTALENSSKHFTESMMWHYEWKQQSMDGWNAFILDSLHLQRKKLKRTTLYGCILNFPSGNKPLKIHTGDFLNLSNPHLHCKKKNVFVSPVCCSRKSQIKLKCGPWHEGTQVCQTGCNTPAKSISVI